MQGSPDPNRTFPGPAADDSGADSSVSLGQVGCCALCDLLMSRYGAQMPALPQAQGRPGKPFRFPDLTSPDIGAAQLELPPSESNS